MSRAAIVDPYRRPIGAEQSICAAADAIEAGGNVQRRGKARREVVKQLTDVALQLFVFSQPEEFQRRQEYVRQFSDPATDRLGVRRPGETDHE